MRRPLLVIMSLCLAGCATLNYQEPVQGSRARVRFITTSSSPTVLWAYDDINCTQNETEWMRLRVGYLLNSDPKKLGMPLWSYHENAAKEVYVDASKQMHGMFSGSEQIGMIIYSCGVPFSFMFSENNDYEVKYQRSPDQCSATISQIVSNGNDWSVKEVARFDNRTNDLNSGCLAQFEKVRLY